jgi:hypothetical protein
MFRHVIAHETNDVIEAHFFLEHDRKEFAFNQRKLILIHALNDVLVNITKRVLFSQP